MFLPICQLTNSCQWFPQDLLFIDIHFDIFLLFLIKIAFVWHTNIKPLQLKDQSLKRDFISLNKAATQAGLVTAQEHFQYRATHADRLRRRENRKDNEGTRGATTRLPAISNMVYGVSTKYVHFLFVLTLGLGSKENSVIQSLCLSETLCR